MRPRVFVPYRQQALSADRKTLIDKYPTLNRAEEFGDMVFLLSPNARPFDRNENSALQPLIEEMRPQLAGYTADDYLLLIGNPIIMSAMVAIAADASGGPVRFLQWSRERYIEVTGDLFEDQ